MARWPAMYPYARQPILFAQLDLPVPEADNIVVTLGLIAILVSVATAVVSIWYMTRKNPPVEHYVDREITKLEGRVDSRIDKISEEISGLRKDGDRNTRKLHERIESENKTAQENLDKVRKSLEAGMQDIQRAIGRLEGALIND